MPNVPMVPGKGAVAFEEQQVPLCIFQHLSILGGRREVFG